MKDAEIYFKEALLLQMGRPVGIRGFGNHDLITYWYKHLPRNVRERVDSTVFSGFIDHLHSNKTNTMLLQALAEKWWDTTHTFHMNCIGEMTVTPTDFSSITGFPMSGRPIKFDDNIHSRRDILSRYLGEPITNISDPLVDVPWLYENYGNHNSVATIDEDIMVRVFILALLGATLFANTENQVHLGYLPSLYNIDKINNFDWGSAGLAFLYHQMDDVCRSNTTCLGGYLPVWQVSYLET